ncbi:hypothetical protein H206_06960 [Candidatus Electrothrix aarhusensis]|uniref:Uncharacterized protein n=1 Tax=Candidatus Electrothrix aarhusensis TaxID=1859131 RepID=A0A444J3T7_9BACT|nr:hypothetical protein H206_06960 [Candidatus Electrothrix aarhusensis]
MRGIILFSYNLQPEFRLQEHGSYFAKNTKRYLFLFCLHQKFYING